MVKTLEHNEQVALFEWAKLVSKRYPELDLMFAVPNGGKRHKAVALKMMREGAKSGVPDIFLPVPSGNWHGLFIEMKVGSNKPTGNQVWWLENLAEQGYRTEVCYGFEEAQKIIEEYLDVRR